MVKVVVAPENEDYADDDPVMGLSRRKPIIFDDETRTVYVGGTSWHHTGNQKTYGLSEHGSNFSYGWVGVAPRQKNQHGDIGWYGSMAPSAEDQAEINQALSEKLGLNVESVNPDQWHFGAQESHGVLNWEEGYDGKGLLDPEGNLHNWVDGLDHDTHLDYLVHNNLPQAQAYLIIKPHGAFYGADGAISPQDIETIERQDPRLRYGQMAPWAFGV